MGLTLHVLPDQLAICQLAPDATLEPPAYNRSLWALAVTADERSLVCAETDIPAGVIQVERGWQALRVAGTLDFSLTGVLAGLSATLAQADIPIFAVSTYDTDYILVKVGKLQAAVSALYAAGYEVQDHPPGKPAGSGTQAEVNG